MIKLTEIKAKDSLVFIAGLALVCITSSCSFFISQNGIFKELGLSSLIIGVISGIMYGNSIKLMFPGLFQSSITFCAKKILRLAIILYGFNITFQDILGVGPSAITTSSVMLITTFCLVVFVGVKLFRLDKELTILIASGASVCGAAAVLATESQLKSPPHKTSIAIITVVLFGTISMFLYPALMQNELLPLSASQYGIYIGSTVHEVAQVVVAANAVEGATSNAVIVKMVRVLLLPVLLIVLGFAMRNKSGKINIPWFAVVFLLVGIFNSFKLLGDTTVASLITLDKALLTIAMTALGMDTNLTNLLSAGFKPIMLAFVTFIWLILGGLLINMAIV